MRYPEFLKENGTIGFVAPSFGCATEPYKTAFDHAIDKFLALGHKADIGPNCYLDRGIGISNTPEACGKELTEYYLRKENEILISCGGGELMCETLPFIDFAKLAQARPKWYMGYSDNTNFTFLSTTLCDTAAVYGPCASAFGMEPWHTSIQDCWDFLTGKKLEFCSYPLWERESQKSEEAPLAPYHVTEPVVIRCFPENPGKLQGRLIGGCMDCLINLLGTEFDHVKEFSERYKEDGFIWFLESCELNVMSIRRAVWQMKHAGWFAYVKAFLIGRPLCFGEEMFGIDQYRAVTDLLAEFEVPIFMDLDIGHLAPMMPIVCGAMAEIQMEDEVFKITYILE